MLPVAGPNFSTTHWLTELTHYNAFSNVVVGSGGTAYFAIANISRNMYVSKTHDLVN